MEGCYATLPKAITTNDDGEFMTRFELTELEALAEKSDSRSKLYHEPLLNSFNHFIEAQDHEGTYLRALHELRSGKKETHWIWYIFPILYDQNMSPTSEKFALRLGCQARMYLEHPVLGPRLEEAAYAVLVPNIKDISTILYEFDAIKLHKSATLFEFVHPKEDNVFRKVLKRYFSDQHHNGTNRELSHGQGYGGRGLQYLTPDIIEKEKAARAQVPRD